MFLVISAHVTTYNFITLDKKSNFYARFEEFEKILFVFSPYFR